MKYRMFAVYTLDTLGRAEWSLNEGESLAEVEEGVRRAGPTWTPPTHYVQVTARDLTGAERKALRRDTNGLDWHLAHNSPPMPPTQGMNFHCDACGHDRDEHAFFPGGEPAPLCIAAYRPEDAALIDHACDCEGYEAASEHACEYTEDGADPTPDHPACGAPATVMNPRSHVDFDYEEWFCARHADPAWLTP